MPSNDVPEISGATRLYGIVADPIGHVRTPQELNRLMRRHCVDGIMVPFHVAPADLARFMDGIRVTRSFGGLIATVPHKTAMLDLCDVVSEQARLIGAVNAVRREPDGRLAADMFDGDGFVAGLREAGHEPAGRRAYMAGAGGAAQLGATGWSFEDVLPYFRRLEHFEDQNAPLRGRHGPMSVVRVRERFPIAEAFIAAAEQAGSRAIRTTTCATRRASAIIR